MISGISSAVLSQIQQIMQQYGCTETQAEAIAGEKPVSESLGQLTSATQTVSSSANSQLATDPHDPSTITSEQLKSPIDIKI